jgi:hypothetical protein
MTFKFLVHIAISKEGTLFGFKGKFLMIIGTKIEPKHAYPKIRREG